MVDNKTMANSLQADGSQEEKTVDDVVLSYIKQFKLVEKPTKSRKSATEIGLLIKPINIPHESLNGIQLKPNSTEVIELQCGTNNTDKVSYNFVNSDEKGIGHSRKVFSPSNDEWKWKVVQPTQHFRINEAIPEMKVNLKNLIPTPQPPSIPSGLWQRFKPFGYKQPLSTVEIHVNVHSSPPKKAKKKKHKEAKYIKPEELLQSNFPQVSTINSNNTAEDQVSKPKKKKSHKQKSKKKTKTEPT